MSRLPLLQRGEEAASVIIGDDESEVRPRLQLAHDEARRVVQRGQISQQGVGRTFQRKRNSGGGGDIPVDS